jgi:hypothetical protein
MSMQNPAIVAFVQPYSTRIMASGIVSLAAGAADSYSGENARQKRWQFICSNLDSTNSLYLRKATGLVFLPVNPGESKTVDSTEDIQVYNPSSTDAVNYVVCERFMDAGSLGGGGVAPAAPAAAAAAASSPGGTSSSGGGGSSWTPGDSAPPGRYLA